ncbi:PREDICTED: uncharacterized protein KIAA0513-like [Priapulus caudatus]|uniref:Uncharacterized protein KIAA0513-like n=1 Tax=Priapulus caudatus TaxID=37621 RepID=A0ABM1EMY1_PRICU|nr:PREDICTED: uncharacterized protein KIAA0513-like [Priapulus caudatus]
MSMSAASKNTGADSGCQSDEDQAPLVFVADPSGEEYHNERLKDFEIEDVVQDCTPRKCAIIPVDGSTPTPCAIPAEIVHHWPVDSPISDDSEGSGIIAEQCTNSQHRRCNSAVTCNTSSSSTSFDLQDISDLDLLDLPTDHTFVSSISSSSEQDSGLPSFSPSLDSKDLLLELSNQEEYFDFMQSFVGLIFANSAEISQILKAKFGECCQAAQGRLWFSKLLSKQRVKNKQVSERTFYSLVQYLAIALFECHEADDFTPARTLMNMCFTFYTLQSGIQHHEGQRVYLYSHLHNQPIWQCQRFWSAAFYDAFQQERANRPLFTRNEWDSISSEEQEDEKRYQQNVAFGQLGTFTYNMVQLGMPKALCLDFLRKQSTICNLTTEQVELLQENLERIS